MAATMKIKQITCQISNSCYFSGLTELVVGAERVFVK